MELATEYFSRGTDLDNNVTAVATNLHNMYGILDAAGMFLTDDELLRFDNAVVGFGVAMQGLREWGRSRSLDVWQVRPKLHKAMHLPLMSTMINPRCVSCYINESQIGTTTRTWKGSVSGRYKGHVQKTVLGKRWLGAILRLEDDV